MDYKESVSFIESVSWKGSVPGLERISALCDILGNPERDVRFVHVAGTNGKGSTSAIISSILTSAGYKTGLFTSPHLIDYTERFKIDGEDISKREFCAVAERVKREAERMDDAPTEFEILTAMAFVYFSENNCDVAVLECGMGGRLDATNVIGTPLASVITNIALDHTSILGDTEEKIAAEKAGIIKGAPTVVGKVSANAEKVIKDTCIKHGSDLISYLEAPVDGDEVTRRGTSFNYNGYETLLPLCGAYQTVNLRCAIAAICVLKNEGFAIKDIDVKRGIEKVRWIGRFEKLSSDPVVIFDGAHNPDGAEYAAKTFGVLFPDEKAILVTGVMADKDYGSVAGILSTVASRVYCVKPDNPRALAPETLAGVYEKTGVEAIPCPSVSDGVKRAFRDAKREGRAVFCTGSLYMYGEIVSALDNIKNS